MLQFYGYIHKAYLNAFSIESLLRNNFVNVHPKLITLPPQLKSNC